MIHQSCPVSFHNVDGTLARIGSFYIFVSIVLFLVTSQQLILYFLILDFLTRLSGLQRYSLVYYMARVTKRLLGFSSETVDGSAKRLAAYFGLLFVVLLSLEALFKLHIALYATAAFFLLCAGLEIVFDYCIGCKIYFIIKSIYPDFMS
jgi:hypothetical protein